MAVTITWKISDVAVTEVDHGSGAAGSTLTAKEIEVSHDGAYQLTGCKFYVALFSDTYTGGASAVADLAEILAWGEEVIAAAWGGLELNMNAVNSFPSSDWPAYNDHFDIANSKYAVFKTGQGDSAANGITLSTAMSTAMSTGGVIPASASPWPTFQVKVGIPSAEGTTGVRQFSQKMRFSYTS